MAQFSYKATGSNGNEVQGFLEANDLQSAKSKTLSMDLDPIEIYPTPALSAKKKSSPSVYLPLFETLRLYAGWLLAWYALVYIIGAYQFMKDLPFRIPYAESLFLSPLVLSFTFAAYLFLLFSSLYMASGRKKIVAFLLCVAGIGLFVLYRSNIQ